MSTEAIIIKKKKSMTPKLRYKGFEEEWGIWRLEEVCDEIFLGLTSKVDYVTEGGFPFVRASNITTGRLLFDDVLYISEEQHKKLTKKRLTKRGDILVNKSGSLGTCIIVDTDIEFSTYESIITIQPSRERVLNTYLLQVLQDDRTQNRMLGNKVGSIVGHLNLLAFRKLNVPIPSLPEQQKIASFLSAVDEKIQQLTRKKELLEQYKKGVMQQLFSGKLRFKDENGKPYPKWEEKRLGDICDLKNGYAFKSSSYNEGGSYNIVTIKNVQGGKMVDPFTKIETLPVNLEGHQKLNIGDILISMTGNVGRVCYVTFENCLLNQRVGKIEPIGVPSDYLYQILNTTEFLDAMVNIGQGAAQLNIGKKDILDYEVRVASSKSEQQKIASFLTALDAKIESVAAQISHTQTFKKGLLQQMFV